MRSRRAGRSRRARRVPATAPVRRRRAQVRATVAVVVLALLAVVVVVVVSGSFDRAMAPFAPDAPAPPDVVADGDQQPSMVVITYDGTEPSEQADGVLVLAYDREAQQGTILLVPTATVADVPGHGSFQLREAFALGGQPLVQASLANLLGVRFDGSAALSHEGWAALLERSGGFELDVRARLVDEAAADAGPRFEPGPQFLDGPRLADYLTLRAESETELETLPRVQDVVVGLLERIGEEPGLLDELFTDGAPMIETTDPDLARTLLRALSGARAEGRVTTATLPVATLGSGREDSYRLDASRAEALVTDQLAASRPTDVAGAGRSVQILNGNGVPGIGQQVAERLHDGGYRIVLTGNADSFDHTTTRILVYDASDEQLAVAQDVRDRLGVGEIQRSGSTQSVVDVTVVVGADFVD